MACRAFPFSLLPPSLRYQPCLQEVWGWHSHYQVKLITLLSLAFGILKSFDCTYELWPKTALTTSFLHIYVLQIFNHKIFYHSCWLQQIASLGGNCSGDLWPCHAHTLAAWTLTFYGKIGTLVLDCDLRNEEEGSDWSVDGDVARCLGYLEVGQR